MHTFRSIPLRWLASACLTVPLLAACGGGGSGGSGGSSGDGGTPTLSATPDIMQMHLSWGGPDTVDIRYSSDPDCDWDNYNTCDDSGMLVGVAGGSLTLRAVDDPTAGHGFDPDTGWYFVAESGSERSNQVGARPGPVDAADGRVYAVDATDETVYIGGAFDLVGMRTGGGAMLTLDEGELTGSVPVLAGFGDPGLGAVYDTAPDGQGGWYVAGQFDGVSGKERGNLVRIRPDGSVDPGWRADAVINEPDEFAVVRTIIVVGDRVYIGGDFKQIERGGETYPRKRLAALDAQTGEVVADWNPGADDVVTTLAPGDEVIYAGGEFSKVGDDDTLRNKLAAFDPADGSVDSSWDPEVSEGSGVYALKHAEGTVYIGGDFSKVDNEDANNLAAVDAVDGGLDHDWSAGVDGDHVGTLALAEGRLFVGGEFDRAGGAPRSHLAAFHAGSGELVDDWAPDPDDRLSGMAIDNGRLYIVGNFRSLGEDDNPRRALAAVATDTGELDPDWVPTAYDNFTGFLEGGGDISVSSGVAFAGANNLTGIGAHITSVAAIDRSSGILDRDWQFELNGNVWAIKSTENDVYIGGSFDHISGVRRDRLAAISRDTGELHNDWDPSPDDSVQALLLTDENLYVGGRFDKIDGQSISGLARLDVVNGAADPDWDANMTWDTDIAVQGVESMLLDDDTLYVGGRFEQVKGDDRDNLAAIAIDSAEHDDDLAEASSTVRAMALGDGKLYIGGNFSNPVSVDGERRNHLAAINTATGDVDVDWDPGANRAVRSLLLHDDTLLAGGEFRGIGGGSGDCAFTRTEDCAFLRDRLAALDPVSGDVNPDWDRVANSVVESMVEKDGSIFIVGWFANVYRSIDDGPERKPRRGLMHIESETGELLW